MLTASSMIETERRRQPQSANADSPMAVRVPRI